MKLLSQDRNKKHKQLLENVSACLGKPYQYGAGLDEAPQKFDCSSLVQYLYKQIELDLPRSSIQQAHLGKVIRYDTDKSNLQVGDLLFFRGVIGHYNREFPQGIGHVAVYLGHSECLHTTGISGKVVKVHLQELLNRGDLVVIKRIL